MAADGRTGVRLSVASQFFNNADVDTLVASGEYSAEDSTSEKVSRWKSKAPRNFGINFLHYTCVWKQRSYSMVHFSVLTCLKHQAWIIYQRKNVFLKKIGRRKMLCLLCLKQCSSKLRGSKIPGHHFEIGLTIT